MADKDGGKKGGKKDPDEIPQDQLKDWKKLNENPPHVGPLKKEGKKKSEQ